MTAAVADPVIALAGVTKVFRRRRVLDGLDLDVRAGEIVGLLGPNGSGKTTTLRIAAGYLWPDAGSVRFDGEPLTPACRDLRRAIGYLPERVPLYDPFSVDRFLGFIAAARGLRGARRKAALDRVVNDFGLGAVRDRTIGRLSKGFRQRVGLAQALIGDPRLLLLDEPTNGLDPVRTLEARDLIRVASRARAVIISTHILQEVAALCSRVVYLRAGRLVELASAASPLPGHERIEAVIAAPDPATVEAALGALDAGASVIERQTLPHGRLRLVLSVPADAGTRGRVARVIAANASLLEFGTSAAALEARLASAIGSEGEPP